MLVVGTAQSIIVCRARDSDQVVALEVPVHILEGVFVRVGVV